MKRTPRSAGVLVLAAGLVAAAPASAGPASPAGDKALTGFIKIVPSIADRDLDVYPIDAPAASSQAPPSAADATPAPDPPAAPPAVEESGPPAAVTAASVPETAVGASTPPAAETAPAIEKPAGEQAPVLSPLSSPADSVSLAVPLETGGTMPDWTKPIIPDPVPPDLPVETTVAAPGSDIEAAVDALVAKLGDVHVKKSWVYAATGRPEGLVAIYAMNLREVLVVDPYDEDGALVPEALALFAKVLRYHKTDAEHEVDPMLARLLYAMALAHDGVLFVSSGYREPGGSTKPTSYHTKGMAADLRHPYLPAKSLVDFARAWGAGGVGYYPRTQFVHVDVRDEPFYWIDYSGKGEKGKVIPDWDGSKADAAAVEYEGVEPEEESSEPDSGPESQDV